MEYMEAKRCYTDAKAKQRSLHKRVQTLQQKNQPMHNFKKRLETRLKRINDQRDGKKEAAKKRFKSMKVKWDDNEKLVYYRLSFWCSHLTCRSSQESQAEDISNKLSNLKKEEKSRAKKIQEIEQSIQKLQAELAKPLQVENMSEIDEEIVRPFPFAGCALPDFSGQRRLNQGHSGTRTRQEDLKEQQRRLVEDQSRANAEIAEGERAYAIHYYGFVASIYSGSWLG
jgi:hypothetical protein